MPNTDTTPSKPTNEEILAAVEALGGIAKVEKDIAYLRTIVFAVDVKAIQSVTRDIDFTADELQTAFLDIREADRFKRLSDNELTVVLFASAVKAAKRSIDYAESNRDARKQRDARDRYERWAEANPKLAANPLMDLPMRFSYGLLKEETFKMLMSEAQAAAKAQASQNAASL